MKKLAFILIIALTSIANAQGDDCFNATPLGTLPAPPACGTGSQTASSSINYNGTTIGATAENPYSSLSCMDAPAADVWVTFVASGNEMMLDFTSSLNDANIGIYTGDCVSGLVGLFCETSNNGNINTLLTPFTPGDTYYMQISGIDEFDFANFNLQLTAVNNCDLCVLESNITASPAPTNGFYLPGTTVQFCYEITEYEQVSANWIHGVLPSFGSSWDMSTLTPVSAPNASGNYEWIWVDPPGSDPIGWYVDDDPSGPSTGDGDPTNNFGDNGVSGVGSWTFCWQITTSTSCSPGGDLGMTINTTADGETGSWTSPACTGDPDVPFTAFMLCCDVPLTSFVDPSCDNTLDGSVSATGQGGTAPYDYVWTDVGGAVVGTSNNLGAGVASTITGLGNGTYTATVTDNNGCVQLIDVTIAGPACPPCIITGFTANPSITCPSATYSTTGTVTFSNAPTTGTLTVSDCNGNQQVFTAPFTSPQNYTITGQTPDGAACNVTAVFSADAACTNTINYTAPICPCIITNFVANVGSCDAATDTYPMSGTVEFVTPPTSGTLVISVNNGTATTYDTIINMPFTSPQTWSISGIPSDAANSTITATFSADGTCTSAINYTAPQSCACPADIGTFNQNMVGNGNTNYVLCFGDQFNYQSNGDYTPPNDVNNPPPAYNPGIAYLIYTCPPTPGIEPNTDPCLLGITSSGTGNVLFSDINDGFGIFDLYPAGTFTNNTVYYVPITMYDIVGNYYSNVIAPNPSCYDLGPAIAVQYLPEIKTTEVEDCQAGTITSTITGGLPEVDGSNYNIVPGSLSPANASFVNTSTGFGGTITIQGLTNGQSYSYNIVDNNGCPITVSGVFIGTEDPSFNYNNLSICTNGTNPTVNITGTPGGTFSYTVVSGGPTLSLNTSTGAVNVGASNPGVYDITYTTPDAVCFSDSTLTMTILEVPTVNPVTDQAVCDGSDFTAINFSGTPTAGVSYDWTNSNTAIGLGASGTGNIGAFTGTNTGTTPITGTVTVTPTLGTCVGTPTNFNLTVNPIPVINAGPDQTVCEPNTVTLTATNPSGATISWDNGVTDGVAFASPIGATTTYTVTATLAGCTNTDQVDVTVNPLPTIGAGPDQTECEGTAITLTANNPDGAALVWDNGVIDGTPFTPAVGTVTYTVTGTLLGCSSSDVVDVTINPNPVFTVAGTDPTTCGGNDGFVTLSGLTPNTNYDVTYTDNGTVTGPNVMMSDGAGEITIGSLTQGSYTDFIVSLLSCATTDNTIINLVDPSAPTVNAGTDITVCEPNTVTLTANNPDGAIITWDNGVTDGVAFASPIGQTVTYTVTADLAGCISTDQVNVTVNPLPTIGAGPDQTLCDGILVNLIATNPDNATISWDNGVTDGFAFQPPIGTTTYTVTATLLGCVSTDAVDITVNALDDPGFSYPAYSYCTAEANPIATISGTTGGTFSFTATSGGPNLSIDPSTGLIDLANSNPGTYDITYTTPGVCPLDSTITMNIALTPTVNPVTDQVVCHGANFTFINFNGSVGSTFDWTNDNTSIGLAASGTGDIPTFTGTNTSGVQQVANIVVTPSAGSCVGTTTTFTLTVNPLDNPGFNYNPTSYCATDANPTPTIDVPGGTFTYFTTNGVGTITLDPNTGVVDLTTSNSGSFDITYTTAGPDCPQDSTINITINPIPTVNTVPDQTICDGSTFNLIDFNGLNNPSFTWTNDNPNIGIPANGTGDIASFTGVTTTNGNEVANITVTPSTATCTGTPTSFTLTVQPLDNPGFVYGQASYCTSDTDPTPTVDAAGGQFTYLATTGGPNLVIDVNTGMIDLSNSDEGIYDITYTTGGPCVQDSTVTVAINFTPTVDPVLPQTVCDNTNGMFTDFSAINFTGTSGSLPTTYDWTNSNSDIGLAASGQGDISSFTGTNNTSAAITGTITVTPSSTGCTGTPITFDLTVNPLDDPSFQYDNGLTYCASGTVDPTVTITGMTGGTFSYTTNSGGPNLVLNTSTGTIDLSGSDVGSYDITYTTNGPCQMTSTLTLVITSAPVADFTIGDFCQNSTANVVPTYINGGSGGQFTASPAGLSINGVTGQVNLSASTPGTYTVTNTIDLTSQGCALATATDNITIHEVPTISITGGTTICPTDALPDLTVTFTNTANGPFDFNYSINGGANIAINGVTSPYTLTPNQIGDYEVVNVTDANGCTNFGVQIATIDTFPTPTIDYIPNYDVCDGNSLTIPAFTGSPAGNTYNWNMTSGTDLGFGTSGTGTIGMFTGTNPSTSAIEVTPISSNGCSGTPRTFYVSVNELPIAEFSAPDTAGCEPFTVTFTSISDDTNKCFWDFGDGTTADGCGTVTHTYTTSGSFDVGLEVLSPDSCITTVIKPGYINVTPTPVAEFSYTPQVTDVTNTEIEFTNASIDADEYIWDFGDESINSNETDPIHLYPDIPDSYVITLISTNNNGICADTAQATVIIDDILLFYVPNVFTPDNDDYNQTFQPVLTSGFDPYDYHLMIFNRWGELIFESYNATIGWDGTYPEGGELCEDGVYVWKIDFKETMSDKRHNLVGHVTLLK